MRLFLHSKSSPVKPFKQVEVQPELHERKQKLSSLIPRSSSLNVPRFQLRRVKSRVILLAINSRDTSAGLKTKSVKVIYEKHSKFRSGERVRPSSTSSRESFSFSQVP